MIELWYATSGFYSVSFLKGIFEVALLLSYIRPTQKFEPFLTMQHTLRDVFVAFPRVKSFVIERWNI
jgi:hypothetical protein